MNYCFISKHSDNNVANDDQQQLLDQFIDQFKLKREMLYEQSYIDENDGTTKPLIVKLKECLQLSPASRQFVLESLLHKAAVPVDPFLKMITLITFPLFTKWLSKRLLTEAITNKTLIISTIVGLVFSIFGLLWLNRFHHRYGYWAVFTFNNYEENKTGKSDYDRKDDYNDQTFLLAQPQTRETLYAGGREYLIKLKQLHKIVEQCTTSYNIFTRLKNANILLYSIENQLNDLDRLFSDKKDNLNFYLMMKISQLSLKFI